MPIISARGIITPATYWRNFVCFYGARRARKEWDNNQFTALVSVNVPAQIPLQLLLLQLFKVTGIQIEIIRMILTELVRQFCLTETVEALRPNLT
jgi:hypothetical protein